MTTPKNYELVGCQHDRLGTNCRLCGVYFDGDIEAYKTFRYLSEHTEMSSRYMASLKRKNQKAKILTQPASDHETIYDFLQSIVDKFQFSVETLALGLYLYNHLVSSNPSSDYELQPQFYSSVCLMIAAKSIELDRHIPYYSRFMKYACKLHTKREYQQAQIKLIQDFQWNLQRPTFVTFLNLYLSNGVVFSDEEFSRKKVFLVEEKVKEEMIRVLRSGRFVTEDQELVAARVLEKARREFGLGWHKRLEGWVGVDRVREQEVEVLREVVQQQQQQQTPMKENNGQTEKEMAKDMSTISSEKQKQSGLKPKPKTLIHRPLISHNQLKYVPSFTALNLLSMRKADSSTN